jgi:hypothetical protein
MVVWLGDLEAAVFEVIAVTVSVTVFGGDEVYDGKNGIIGMLVGPAAAVELDTAAALPKNGAALARSVERMPAVRLAAGHPSLHGLDSQQPINGGVVFAQVYHELPLLHSWAGNSPEYAELKLAGSRSPAGQPSRHGTLLQHPTKRGPAPQA